MTRKASRCILLHMANPARRRKKDSGGPYLTGQILIAMPAMNDPRFSRTVIYVVAHNRDGAMGLVLNRDAEQVSFPDLLEQLGIDKSGARDIPVRFGGPVDVTRGFVLHSTDYAPGEGTLQVTHETAMTTTLDILKAIAHGKGPRKALLALGYAGWGAGQLESEVQENAWAICAPDDLLLFGEALEPKWRQAFDKLGVPPERLSPGFGHA